MNQVHLAQVGLRGISSDTRAVFDRLTTVRIALDTQTSQQHDLPNGLLGKRVRGISVNCYDASDHYKTFQQLRWFN
jgi:hypothetical protein